jgi:hypothetical protein
MSASLPVLAASVVSVPANARIAAYSTSFYQINQIVNNVRTILYAGAGSFTSAVLSASVATTVEIMGGDRASTFYSIGTAAIVPEFPFQPTPGTLNATGTLTAALVFGGIVTSTTAAAVTATLDTGAIMEAAGSFVVGDYVDWSVINTGGSNAFTVTAAASGHTVVGAGAVSASTSGCFRTLKTAANTFVTYRMA